MTALLVAALPKGNVLLQLLHLHKGQSWAGWDVEIESWACISPGSLETPALRLLLKHINYQVLIDPGFPTLSSSQLHL